MIRPGKCMSRNPVFEHFRQRGAFDGEGPVDDEVRLGNTIKLLPAFSYYGHKLRSQSDILQSIVKCRYPLVVLADSCLFSESRIDFVQALLKTTNLVIHPDVRNELADLEGKPPNPLRDFLFPSGRLNRGLTELPHWGIKGFNYVMNKYTNLLHLRKLLLDVHLNRFREEAGRDPSVKERDDIVRELLVQGVSWRTMKLATKKDKNRRHTDEALVVHGVLSPILTGRDCYILTADRDVFDQFYQLTELVYDDFVSHWIGEDYRNQPHAYDHVHEIRTPFMEPGALAIGIQNTYFDFVPTSVPTCATIVFDVNSLECLQWVSIRPMARALHFQESAADGRVADAGNGATAYMSLGDPNCKQAPAHFTVGKSVTAANIQGKDLKLCLTQYDVCRAMSDKHNTGQSRAERRKQKRK